MIEKKNFQIATFVSGDSFFFFFFNHYFSLFTEEFNFLTEISIEKILKEKSSPLFW